jgi:hypothetical protein
MTEAKYENPGIKTRPLYPRLNRLPMGITMPGCKEVKHIGGREMLLAVRAGLSEQ